MDSTAATPTTPQGPSIPDPRGICFFATLPTEMRLNIYKRLLPKNQKFVYSPTQNDAPALLRVANKEIYNEVAEYYYGNNTFEIHLRKVTDESHPHQHQSMCQDKSTCDYDQLMEKILVAYVALGGIAQLRNRRVVIEDLVEHDS